MSDENDDDDDDDGTHKQTILRIKLKTLTEYVAMAGFEGFQS